MKEKVTKRNEEEKGEKNAGQAPKELKGFGVDPEWSGSIAFQLPIFPAVITLFVGSRKDFFTHYADAKAETTKRIVARVRCLPYDPKTELGHTLIEGVYSLILLPSIDMADEKAVASLYHEVLHVAIDIVNRVGLEVGRGGEVLTYLQEFIVKQIFDEIRSGRGREFSSEKGA